MGGSGGRVRTFSIRIQSPAFCQLNYPGSNGRRVARHPRTSERSCERRPRQDSNPRRPASNAGALVR